MQRGGGAVESGQTTILQLNLSRRQQKKTTEMENNYRFRSLEFNSSLISSSVTASSTASLPSLSPSSSSRCRRRHRFSNTSNQNKLIINNLLFLAVLVGLVNCSKHHQQQQQHHQLHSSTSNNNPNNYNNNNNYGNIGNQRFAMEPQDQTAVVGARVTLPCRVINKQGVLQWTKDNFGLGTHRNLSGYERYSMIGSDEEGDYSLDVYPVMLDDDALYECQVSPGPDGEKGLRSTIAKLTVIVPPEPPKILQGDYLLVTEDRKIELECISVGGKPAAEVWYFLFF